MKSVAEEWRTVPRFSDYQVSDCGQVRSLDRLAQHWRGGTKKVRGRILKPIHHKGYLIVKLGHPDASFGIHRLVAWAFIGPQLDGMVVNHIDGNKHNNVPSNLEYVTNSENVHHAYRTGLLNNKGESNGHSVLTEVQARKILSYDHSVRPAAISRELGLPLYQVQQVRSRRTWKHLV